VTSEYSIDTDPDIQAIMALSTDRKPPEETPKKKKSTKKKGNKNEEMETDE